MSSLPKDLLHALGLDPADVEPIASAEPPADHVGRGLASGGTAEERRSEVAREPWFTQSRLAGGAFGRGTVRHWNLDPHVVAVEASPVGMRHFSGEVWLEQGLIVLDGRAGRCAVYVETPAGGIAVTNEAGRVQFGCVRARSPLLNRLSKLSFEDVDSVEVPSPAELLERLDCVAWLADATASLADSPRLGDRVAAVGLLARAWSPLDAGARRAFASGELVVPIERARTWARNLAPSTSDRLERLALLDADDWQSALEGTAEGLIEFPDATAPAVSLLLRRDDLESIAWVLEVAGRGDILRLRLDDLDALGRSHLSALRGAQVAIAANERLDALSWQAPELWWGQW